MSLDDQSPDLTDDKSVRLEEVSRLYRQGYTYKEIAEKTKLSLNNISRMMRSVRTEWKKRATKSFAAHLYEQLAKIDEVEYQAWQGWNKSTRDFVETIIDESYSDEGRPVTDTRIRRYAQPGDAKFLQIISDCIRKRCDLLGLLDPEIRNSSAIDGDVQVVSVVIDSREEAAALQELDFKQFSRLIQNDPVPAEAAE